MKRVTLFWPGDGHAAPNERALHSVRATTAQLGEVPSQARSRTSRH